MAIPRQRAREIAEEAIAGRADAHDPAVVREVYLPAEITVAKSNLYGLNLDDHWVIYVERPSHYLKLGSSEIILVRQDTGHVAYWGSACDEG